MSEYKLLSLGHLHPQHSSAQTLRVSRAGRRHFVGQRWEGDGGDGNQRAGGRLSPCEQGVAGTKQNFKLICPPTCQGLPDWQAQVPTGTKPVNLFWSQGYIQWGKPRRLQNFPLIVSQSHLHAILVLFVFCCFSFSYPYPPIPIYTKTQAESQIH